jgi:tetratricopeptide (TPR) repeat protein
MSAGADEMPLLEMLQVLSRTPVAEAQVRAVVAVTCGRWCAARGEDNEALRLLAHALELVPDLRPAMRLLYRIYLRRGDVRSAVRYLDQEIRATRHPREAAALYRERGKLVETHFGDRGAALQCYQAALKATPRDLAVLRSVETIALHRGDVFGLVTNLEQQVEVLHDPLAIAGVLRDLALIEAGRGGDLWLAADMLSAALDEAKDHPGLAEDLLRVAELGRDPEMRLRAYEAAAEASPDRRAAALTGASRVLRELRERPASLALIHAAADAQPHNLSLWRGLEQLSMATARYDAALLACLGQLRAIGDQDLHARAELYYRVGKLAMIRLDRVTEGLAAMRKALRLDPTHIPALEDSGRYLIAEQAWSQLLELLRSHAANAEAAGLSADERAQSLLRAGQVLEDQIREPERARVVYEEAVAISAFRPAIDRLERLLLQLGRFDALREHYQAELGRAKDSARRVFLLSVLGQLSARDADPSAATRFFVSLLKERPEHLTSLQSLARLLARAGRPKELLTVTEQEIRLTNSATRRAKLLHRAAELALGLGERERAYELLHAALADADDHEASIDLLDTLLRQDGDEDQLAQLLRRRLAHTDDRERRVALHLDLAALLATRLGEKEPALAEIDALLAAWPGHLPGLHRGERLAVDLRRWGLLVKMLREHIKAAKSSRSRALLFLRLAQIRSRELGELTEAIADLRAALQLWPELGVARAHLLDLCLATGDTATLRAAALDGLARERSPGERRAHALLLAAHTDAPELAIQYLSAAAAADPADLTTQLRLTRAARACAQPGLVIAAATAAADRLDADAKATERGFPAALRLLAAAAHEQRGDLTAAEEALAPLLSTPLAPLARRARARIQAERGEATARSIDALLAAAASASPLGSAALRARAAALLLAERDLDRAHEAIKAALQGAPDYLPAYFILVDIELARGQRGAAIAALEGLADRLHDPGPTADLLCRAGLLALDHEDPDERPFLAWHLFGRALSVAPASELAFCGLWQALHRFGKAGAPLLADPLHRRLDVLSRTGGLDSDQLRALAHVAMASDGPRVATAILEKGVAVAGFDAPVYVELARAYAHLDRWSDAVPHLQTALSLEPLSDRRAAIHALLAEAHERAGSREPAIRHHIQASLAGYYPRHGLKSAERLASEIGSVAQRIEVLRLLVEIGDTDDKIRGLRALAEIYAGPRGEPKEAILQLRHLLRLEPTDHPAIDGLRQLLLDQERGEEARAVTIAGVAAHRTALRRRGLRGRHGEHDPGLVVGLHRLFDATEELNGVYTSAAILEILDPKLIPPGRACEDVMPEPWPLPSPREDTFAALCAGKDATIAAFLLLREGLSYLPELPGYPEPPALLSSRLSLPSASSVASVTHALAQALGIHEPDVYFNPNDDAQVVAWGSGTPALIVGRKINAAPNSPFARDKIGRALFRLALGGDHLVQRATTPALVGVLAGLAESVGVTVEFRQDYDQETRDRVLDLLASGAGALDFGEHAERLAATVETFDPAQLRAAFVLAEDRAAVLCAADPRITIRDLRRTGALTAARGQALIAYLLSDDHLSLRRALGYSIELELDMDDVEEIP